MELFCEKQDLIFGYCDTPFVDSVMYCLVVTVADLVVIILNLSNCQ